MKTREAWNQVYIEHGENVPWAVEPELNQWNIQTVSKYLEENPTGRTLLDYGCGLGQVAEHFRQEGYQIELADLSEIVTEKLKKKYQNKVPVYLVEEPKDISKESAYDVILAIGVFHHLNPNKWASFLEDFYNLLKKDGIVFIAGWDETDEEISRIQESAYSHLLRGPVNSLKQYVNQDKFQILADSASKIRYESFSFLRTMHYFVLKKKD